MWAHDNAIESTATDPVIVGDRAYWEWRYVQVDRNGEHQILHGCDLFVIEGDKIAVKQAFRKVGLS
jgi:hypothetical protein